MWQLSLITAPAAEPLDMETEVYPHLRLEPDLVPQETLLRLHVKAARERCEEYTQRQLITATWELALDRWSESSHYSAGRIYLPRPPLQQQLGPVDAPTAGVLSVSYMDEAGETHVLPPERYVVTAPQGPTCGRGSIYPAFASSWWPSVGYYPDSLRIRIRFTAGYGPDFRRVPAGLRQGMLLTVAELDSFREDQTSGVMVSPNLLRAEQLWYPYRVW